MDIQSSDVEMKALQLDDGTRARLAVTLIKSLDADETRTKDEIEALWLNEAHDRLARMESGEDPGVEVGAAISNARDNLNS